MANILPREKRLMILRLLVEGNSIRAVVRITGIHKKTVTRVMVEFGERCDEFLNANVRRVKTSHVEIDEQWTWVAKKQGKLTETQKLDETLGDQYLFLGLDQETKLIITHVIGKRTEETTRQFVAKLANRIVLPESPNVPLEAKPQLSTDGFNTYPNAILDTFGSLAQHGVIIKNYADPNVGRYAPPEIASSERRRVQGIDDLMTICTSHIERFNCTTRQFVKRFCRLTLAFSKKLDNLKAAVALYIAYYNWCWRSRGNDGKGTCGKQRLTPAMQAGLTDRLWKIEDLYDAVMAT
jgi:IS1 family transposase